MAEAYKLQKIRPGSGAMFDRIAWRYDVLNRLLSLGLDHTWRRQLVEALEVRSNMRILDVATGTADVAIRLAKAHEGAHITGLDPSAKMLAQGQQKIDALYLSKQIRLVEGDAMALPFAARQFDASCMAFGIRNVSDRAQCLRELIRVTRSGGRIAILELGEPHGSFLAPVARLHVHYVIPFLGQLLTGGKEYHYLKNSIQAFPSPEQFCKEMQNAGLQKVKVKRFVFGGAHLFVGQVH